MVVLGVETKNKTKYDSQGRGKCQDILNDGVNAVEDALRLLDDLNTQKTQQSTLEVIREYLQKYKEEMIDLRKHCLEIDHETPADPSIYYNHIGLVNGFQQAPFVTSTIADLIRTWTIQYGDEAFKSDREFAEILVREAFSDYYGRVWFVTIPIVFLNRYRRWWAISHEVGHGFYKTIENNLDRKPLSQKLQKVINDTAPPSTEKKDLGAAMMIWLYPWLSELVSDFIGLFLFGLHYLIELRHSFSDTEISVGVRSHPPMGFRMTCLIRTLKAADVDVNRFEKEFEVINPIDSSVDPVLSLFVTPRVAEIFSHWILRQFPQLHLAKRWREILEVPKDASILVLFAGLVLEETEEAMELLLEFKNSLLEKT
jgi:hypothetical protein